MIGDSNFAKYNIKNCKIYHAAFNKIKPVFKVNPQILNSNAVNKAMMNIVIHLTPLAYCTNCILY